MPFDPFGPRAGYRYIADPLGRLGFGRYVAERKLPDPFGRLPVPAKPDREIAELGDPFAIADTVGMAGRNRRRDVAKIETLFGRAGVLDLAETDGVTGYAGLRLDRAIRRFQKRHGLKADGQINPGGETITTLRAVLAAEEEQAPIDKEKPDEDFVPERPPETRDRMDSIPTVPGTLDDNEIIIRNLDDILRILGRRRERRA